MALARQPRFLLHLKEEIRTPLESAARANGRTLTAEINIRLRNSLQGPQAPASAGIAPTPSHPLEVAEPPLPYSPTGQLTPGESAILTTWRRLPADKQISLLALLN